MRDLTPIDDVGVGWFAACRHNEAPRSPVRSDRPARATSFSGCSRRFRRLDIAYCRTPDGCTAEAGIGTLSIGHDSKLFVRSRPSTVFGIPFCDTAGRSVDSDPGAIDGGLGRELRLVAADRCNRLARNSDSCSSIRLGSFVEAYCSFPIKHI
ncbi:protein of unknown function [Methylacidimicrobium sp. AP8]|nr:protein of unknown function [Methylacidimicrobium sp. AP8]